MATTNPAPRRQRVSIYSTPSISDVIFYERLDTKLPTYRKPPPYGTPHVDTINYPNHVFVYVKPADETGWEDWYYAAIRNNQDEYNFEFTQADIGGTQFDAVARTYIIPRSEFDPGTPEVGSLMPDAPTGKFGASDYVLASRKQERIGDSQLDSIFVAERRVYVRRVTMTQNDFDEAFGGVLTARQTLYYTGETVTWNNRQKESITVSGGTPPAAAATNVLILSVVPEDGDTITFGDTLTTFTFRDAPAPPTDIQRAGSVAETSVNIASAINNYSALSSTAVVADNGILFTAKTAGTAGNSIAVSSDFTEESNVWQDDLFTGGLNGGGGNVTLGVVATGFSQSVTVAIASGDSSATVAAKIRDAAAANSAIASKFIVTSEESKVFFEFKVPAPTDSFFNVSLSIPSTGGTTGINPVATSAVVTAGGTQSATVDELFADPSHPFWGLQSNGIAREGKQLTASWYAISERAVVPESFALNGRSYTTTRDYTWPAVLSGIRVEDWELRAGGYNRYVTPLYKHETYSGPCRAFVQETFYTSAPTVVVPQVMLPLPILLATPVLSYREGPTLHNAISLSLSTGTGHPQYRYTAGVYSFPATNFTDWPASIVAADEVQPVRGGYIRSRMTIYRPS